MSNGLADASFFPTAKELSTGLRWVKDHPVLAAAAATAVSVITFLNAAESLAPSRPSATLLHDDADADADDDADERVDGYSGLASADAAVFHKLEVVARRRRVERESLASASTTAVASGSDGKLSAAVSWCDEHGGSLTQVFEDLHVARASSSASDGELDEGEGADEFDAERLDSAASTQSSSNEYAAPVAVAIKKSSTQQSILSALESEVGALERQLCDDSIDTDERCAAALGSPGDAPIGSGAGGAGLDAERQTESPQWGWYVAITPPQDHVHANVPRAALQPTRAGGYRSSHAAAVSGSTLRRSQSGRIS